VDVRLSFSTTIAVGILLPAWYEITGFHALLTPVTSPDVAEPSINAIIKTNTKTPAIRARILEIMISNMPLRIDFKPSM
jgi:hypothetical protein